MESRFLCLELATQVHVPREPLEERANRFCEFVGDDMTRFDCLRLAVKTTGQEHRSTAEAIASKAKEYLAFVVPPAPAAVPVAPQQPEPPKKRGRKR